MWHVSPPVAVWQPCELLYACYLLTYYGNLPHPCVTDHLQVNPHIHVYTVQRPVRLLTLMMNRFRTGQGPRRANLHTRGLVQSHSCDCGQRQTMNHIVKTCPLTKFDGGLNVLHEADDDAAVIWLESTATNARRP